MVESVNTENVVATFGLRVRRRGASLRCWRRKSGAAFVVDSLGSYVTKAGNLVAPRT